MDEGEQMTGNRKFFIALFSILTSVAVIPFIKGIALEFYGCLGTITTGFFAINGVEHWASTKKEG